MTACGIWVASGFIFSCFSASQRGSLKSQWSACGSELNGPTGSACPVAQSLFSPGGNGVIKTPLHGSKWVVLGRDPRSFRNSFAWWESLTFKPKLSDGGSSDERHLRTGISLMWSGSCCPPMRWCSAVWKRDAGKVLTSPCISPGVVYGVIRFGTLCHHCRIPHLWVCPSILWPLGNLRLNANMWTAHGWLAAPSVLHCSQAQGTTATAQHADEIRS